MTRALVVLLALSFVASCSEERVASPGDVRRVLDAQPRRDAQPRGDASAHLQTLAVSRRLPADIVLVVDNSASMAAVQAKLTASLPAFIAALLQVPGAADRLAVMTTDAGDLGTANASPDGPERAGDVVRSFDGAPYFAATGTDLSGCMSLAGTSHGCFRGPDPSTRIVDLGATSPAAALTALTENVRVGTCGSGLEQGLAAAVSGVGKACNAGFLRRESTLVLIVISDEDDSSPIDADVAALLGVADKAADRLRVVELVGAAAGRAAWCGDQAGCGAQVCALGQPPSSPGRDLWSAIPEACKWCTYFGAPDCCSAVPATRWVSFAASVDETVRAAVPELEPDCTGDPGTFRACLVESICQETFDASLVRAAQDVIGAPAVATEFVLDPPAGCADVRVAVERGGQRRDLESQEFTVTPDGSMITVSRDALAAGDFIVVDSSACGAVDAGVDDR